MFYRNLQIFTLPDDLLAQQLDADFALMSGEIAEFLPELFTAFGGLAG